MLPSEILVRGSTFDLEVLSTSTKYDIYVREQNEKKKTFAGVPEAPELSEQKMNDMIAKVKNAKN